MEDWKLLLLLALVVMLVCTAVSVVSDYVICNAKTKDMGFNSRFGILSGCQIEVNPGQWIPLESYYFKQE